jgi:uncharacterized protein (TIRG00374 family)
MTITPGKAGEFLKSYLIRELNGTSISHSAPVVIVERLTDVIAIIILSMYGVFSYHYGSKALIFCAAIVLIFLFVFSYHPLTNNLIKTLYKLPFFSKISYKIETAYQSTHILMTPKPLLLTIILSLVSWFFECSAFYLVFKGLNISASLIHSTFIYAFSTLIGAVSMVPGGLGVAEGSMTGLLIMFEVPKYSAVAATIIIRVSTLWFGVFIGILTFILSKKMFTKVK